MPESADWRRAGPELVLQLVFRPLSRLLVPVLARLRVPPSAVVLGNAVVGLGAAVAIARGELLVGAVLLQLKTLLDNCDGELARATGTVTLTGRYLDTEADLVVNAAVVAALGYLTGLDVLAATAFVALTLVLAVDFNVSELYRERHGTAQPLPPATGTRTERLLTRIYEVLFGPLDRGIRRLWRHVEIDGFAVTLLANLGLSTQLALLGVLLAFDAPEAYLWSCLGCLLLAGALLAVSRRLRAA